MKQQSLFPNDEIPSFPFDDKSLVILLDLNYTLVGNSFLKKQQRNMSYAAKITHEKYRQWLVDLVKGHTVLLCTVRHVSYEIQTLQQIKDQTGWLPDASYFNPERDLWDGGIVKGRYMEQIIPSYGLPQERPYFAIESANSTKAMYRRHTISSVSVGNQVWERLPLPADMLPPPV